MANLAYSALLIGVLLSTIIVVRYSKLRIDWRAFLYSVALVSLPFIVWDVIATERGHWGFNPDFILGVKIFGLPLEEVSFFVFVPLVMLVVLLRVKKHFKIDFSKRIKKDWRIASIAGVALALLLSGDGAEYSMIVSALTLSYCVCLYMRGVYDKFWYYQLILFSVFFVSNLYLTSLPIVEYGEAAITNFRIITIPIEDFFYNFLFFNLFNEIYTTYFK